jgi:hypothetical protein
MCIPALLQFVSSIYRMGLTVCISLILVSFVWSLWETSRKGWMHLQRLHQIPCHHCAFFTGEYNLKCTVHPYKALNEEAIGCPDYESAIVSLIQMQHDTVNKDKNRSTVETINYDR